MKKQTCEFIPMSEIIPKWLAKQNFWGNNSKDANLDNNRPRTLVPASRLVYLCKSTLGQTKKAQIFYRKLNLLGNTYIDLES